MAERVRAEARVDSVVAGKYRLRALLGCGGMGSVYDAVHRFTNRRVAVKLMHAGLAQIPGWSARFVREARAPSAIRHPGLVEILDGGEDAGGDLYLVMEYLEGETLRDALKRSDFGAVEFVGVVVDLLDALGAAHAAGFVHRDIKPDNVFLTRAMSHVPPRVKLLDFGIAGLLDRGSATQLTVTGAVLGTPAYMSPEQAAGQRVDAGTDLWAVGAMLYRGFAGRPPYRGDSYNQLVVAIATSEHPPLARLRPELPRSLVDIVDRALSRPRERRFADASEMHRALAATASDPAMRRATLLREAPQASGDATPVLPETSPGPPEGAEPFAVTVRERKRPSAMKAPEGRGVAGAASPRARSALASGPPRPHARAEPTRAGIGVWLWGVAAVVGLAVALVLFARMQRRTPADASMPLSVARERPEPPRSPEPRTVAPAQSSPPTGGAPAPVPVAHPKREAPVAPEKTGGPAGATAEPVPPNVHEGIGAQELAAVVAEHQAALKHCHQDAMVAGHREPVSLNVELAVEPSGRVSAASTRGPSPPGLSDCVVQEVKRWSFRATETRTEVSFPVLFEAVVVEM